MAYFDKLLIQGVRSFGPGENEQVRFDSPLTVIVGRNGCGKTTIIESLRYVTCGEFPPGVKGNQFVHDPKIANETETKAQIRLKFNDVAGKSVSIIRSMQVMQKAKKQEFKTVEGVISQLDSAGKVTSSVSSKCADVDKEMANLLGVSKAVLNNVIFCHQEESNWPLDDPRHVKNRFDEIFAASRYIKAIDEFKKVKKQRNDVAKQCQIEAGYLKVNKEKFEELTGLCSKNESKLQDVKNRIDLIGDERNVNEKKLEEMKMKMQKVNELISRKDSASISSEEKKYQIDHLKSHLKSGHNLFTGSDNDLEEALEKHDHVNETRKEKENDMLNKIEQTTKRIEGLTRKLEEQKTTVADIRTKIALHQEDKINLAGIKGSLIDQLNVGSKISVSGDDDENSLNDFCREISEEIEALNTKKNEEMKNFQSKEDKAQKEIDNFLFELNRVQDTIKRDNLEIGNLDRELEESKVAMQEIEQSGNKMKQLRSQISNMKAKLKQHEKTLDENESCQKRNELKVEIENQEKKLMKLGIELTTSSKATALMESLKQIRTTLDTRTSANSRIMSKRSGDLIDVLGELPKSNLKSTVGAILTQKTTELNEITKLLNAKSVEIESCKFKRKSFADSLREKEGEKTDIETKIDCSVSSYNSEIDNISSSIKELQDKIGCLKGSSTLYSQYCAKLQELHPTCPVCFRGFEDKKSSGSAQEAIERLKELKNRIPCSVKSEELKLKSKEEKLKKIYDSRHLYVQHESLCRQIPELKADVEKCGKEESRLSEEIEDLQLQLDLFQSEVSILNESMADLAEYDRNEKDIFELQNNLANEEKKVLLYGSVRPLEKVNLEKGEVEKELSGLRSSMDQLLENIEAYQKTKSKHQEEILSMERKLVELSSKNQRADQISEKMKELTDKKEHLTAEIKSSRTKIGPIQKDADAAKVQKAKILKERETRLNEVSGLYSKVVASFEQFETVSNKIQQFQNSDKLSKLEKFEKVVSDAENDVKSCRNSLSTFQTELAAVKEELANEAIQRRIYEDNLNLRLLMQEHERLCKLAAELEKQIATSQGPIFKKEYQSMIETQDKLNREFYQATGQQEELDNTIKDLKKQLDDPIYKDAKDKWVRMVTEWKVNKMAGVDIDKFSKALDSALMRFHGMKMREINDILAQLWRDVYTGTDIDTIEIRTEEGENSTATRKTYNYRVVMVKQGVELDMRGRCSAGQKVLASLLIRLALAETFCLQCGVFSLDEPTTNLDRENIDSLAEALVNLIRKRHKNSQFVIITHDMEFVELLGHAELVEHFHEVTRNDTNGLSMITRKSIREMVSNN